VTPITISHLQLLNPVLSVHPPSAIIVQSSFLHTLLEQLADEKEEGLNLIVVSLICLTKLNCLIPRLVTQVGEIDAVAESHARKTGIHLLHWADILESGSDALNLETEDLPSMSDYS
jgi:hypothetical protein